MCHSFYDVIRTLPFKIQQAKDTLPLHSFFPLIMIQLYFGDVNKVPVTRSLLSHTAND